MVDIVVIALIAAAFGAIVWGVDKHHDRYGLLLPSGVSVLAALLTWIVTVAFGLGYAPGLSWIPWIGSLVVGAAASIGVVLVLGRRRRRHDVAKLTAALKL